MLGKVRKSKADLAASSFSSWFGHVCTCVGKVKKCPDRKMSHLRNFQKQEVMIHVWGPAASSSSVPPSPVQLWSQTVTPGSARGAAYNWNILIPRAAIVMLLLLTRIPQHILNIIIYSVIKYGNTWIMLHLQFYRTLNLYYAIKIQDFRLEPITAQTETQGGSRDSLKSIYDVSVSHLYHNC